MLLTVWLGTCKIFPTNETVGVGRLRLVLFRNVAYAVLMSMLKCQDTSHFSEKQLYNQRLTVDKTYPRFFFFFCKHHERSELPKKI